VRGIVTLSLLVVLGSCAKSGTFRCPDGRVCPSGTTCVMELDLCVEPDRVAACAGQEEGASCLTAAIAAGVCYGGVCFVPGCGNGILEPGEDCDDGNTISGDGCSADCLSDGTCGNGFVDPGEQCDCGTPARPSSACARPNSAIDGLCRLDCVLHCGDGVIGPDEVCDPGADEQPSCIDLPGLSFDRGLTTCASSCTPIVSGTCKYIGLRGVAGGTAARVRDLAAYAAGRGFYIATLPVPGSVGHYVDHGPAGGLHTSPSGSFHAVWTAGPDLAVAVGAAGAASRWNGSSWTDDATPVTADLHDVWGRSASDVYAVGDAGTILHFDGAAWTVVAAGTTASLRGVAGTADAVFAVGEGGTIVIDSGSGFSEAASGTGADLRGAWATDAMAVAVGAGGTIVEDRGDGDGWRPGRSSASANLTSVWGSDADGFFAVGEHGTLLFFDGAVWRPLSLGADPSLVESQTLLTISGVPGEDLVVAGDAHGAYYEGAAWAPTALPAPVTINGLWGTAPDHVFAVGRAGAIFHHDGLGWTAQVSGTTADLHAVRGRGPDDVYAVGDGGVILHYDGSGWTQRTSPTTQRLLAVWPGDPGTLYVAGERGSDPLAFAGAFLIDEQGVASPQVLTAHSVHDLWWDGQRLWGAIQEGPTALLSWLVEAGQLPPHTSVSIPQASFEALSGYPDGSKFAVGGQYSHSVSIQSTFGIPGDPEYGTWTVGPFGSGAPLRDVWADPDRGVFAVGANGRLARFDGAVAEPLRSRRTGELRAVFVTGHLVFMAGVDGALDVLVLHR
jgi:cysteine-rich repeat protein